MAKPDPFELNYLIKLHKEDFVKFELWVADGLTEHLIRSKDLDPSYTTVVVDIDEDNPVADSGKIRLNGRFYIPTTDKMGTDLNLEPTDWVEITNQWFEENELEVTIDDNPRDLIKFTVFVEGIALPEMLSSEDDLGSEKDMGIEDLSNEEDLGSEENLSEDLEDDEFSGGGDDEPPSDDENDLKEFEKSLGL